MWRRWLLIVVVLGAVVKLRLAARQNARRIAYVAGAMRCAVLRWGKKGDRRFFGPSVCCGKCGKVCCRVFVCSNIYYEEGSSLVGWLAINASCMHKLWTLCGRRRRIFRCRCWCVCANDNTHATTRHTFLQVQRVCGGLAWPRAASLTRRIGEVDDGRPACIYKQTYDDARVFSTPGERLTLYE